MKQFDNEQDIVFIINTKCIQQMSFVFIFHSGTDDVNGIGTIDIVRCF